MHAEETALRASWRARRRLLVEKHNALKRLQELKFRIWNQQMVEVKMAKAKMGEHVGEK